MKIGIGNDHSAVEMKQDIAAYLEEKGYEVVNYGTDSHESCDYPVYGEKVGRAVAAGGGGVGVPDLAFPLRRTRYAGSGQSFAASRTQQDLPDSIMTPTSWHLVHG